MMIQQERAAAAAAPTPKKRKGKFRKSRLRLLKKDGGHNISMPTGIDIQLTRWPESLFQSVGRHWSIASTFIWSPFSFSHMALIFTKKKKRTGE